MRLWIGELKEKPTMAVISGQESTPIYIFSGGTITDEQYNDITSVRNWHNIGFGRYDYIFVRNQMRQYTSAVTFTSLSSADKEMCLEYCACDNTTLIGYIMARDQVSQAVAIDTFLDYRSKDIRSAAKCFYDRIDNHEFTKTVIKYLGMSGAETFLDASRNFIMDLKDSAVIGTQYGNGRDGIMDYIESTGSYTDAGLQNYSIEPGLTLEDLVSELNDIIINGGI